MLQGLMLVLKCVQEDMNQGSAWERLCTERDPFILTGLMWSWLEQLKEPIISIKDAKALKPCNTDAKTALNKLGQVRGYSELLNCRHNRKKKTL